MHLAIEAFAAVNLCMDALSLLAAQRLCSPQRTHPARVAAGALVGTGYAFWHALVPMQGVFAIGGCVLTTYIMAAIAIPARNWRERLRGCGLLLGCCMLAGGACTACERLFGAGVMALLCGAGVCALFMPLLKKAGSRAVSAAVVTCMYRGRQTRMRALIDTGNRLSDPLTGLPVIAAPREALGAIIPESVQASDPATMPPGFRLLRAQTAAGPCLLMCFHPQQLMIEYEGRCASVQALIALSTASEGAMALVPSELVGYGSAVQS